MKKKSHYYFLVTVYIITIYTKCHRLILKFDSKAIVVIGMLNRLLVTKEISKN